MRSFHYVSAFLTGAGQKYQRNADRRISRSMPIRIHGRTGDAVFSSSSRTTDLISQASKNGKTIQVMIINASFMGDSFLSYPIVSGSYFRIIDEN